MSDTDLLAAALQYAASGLAVFACHYPVINGVARCSCGHPECASPAKHPYGRLAPGGCNSASKDPAVLTRWFRGGPYNIAIATGAVSGIVVLDVDPEHGGDDSLKRLDAEHGALPPTWRVLTGGGGEHFYFCYPGRPVANSAGGIAPGLDIRGDGGYVIAAESRHICGRHYAWNVDFHPDEVPLDALPEWLCTAVAPRERSQANIDWKAFAHTIAPEGGRHNAIISLAGLLFYRMAPEAHLAGELLYSWNLTHCNPPLPELEVRRMVEWAAARERDRRTGATR